MRAVFKSQNIFPPDFIYYNHVIIAQLLDQTASESTLCAYTEAVVHHIKSLAGNSSWRKVQVKAFWFHPSTFLLHYKLPLLFVSVTPLRRHNIIKRKEETKAIHKAPYNHKKYPKKLGSVCSLSTAPWCKTKRSRFILNSPDLWGIKNMPGSLLQVNKNCRKC